jgi:UPF0059 membrane protein vpar_1218
MKCNIFKGKVLGNAKHFYCYVQEVLVSYLEIFILSVGLAMDAFAVSICKSSQMKDDPTMKKVILAFLFGGFQCLMPIIGAAVGAQFSQNFDEWDHWVIFITLGYLGINMIRTSLSDEEEDTSSVDWKEMLALSIATSIDALAVGVTIALLHVDVYFTSLTIGVITFLVCLVGIFSGYHMMKAFRERAEMAGGVILILIGVKILLQHLGYLPR